eukprot:4285053-Pleurochrysis_carterae.AAC.1
MNIKSRYKKDGTTGETLGNMNKAFQRWKTKIKYESKERVDGKEEGDRKLEKVRTYGIKNWGKVKTIPRIHKQAKSFLQTGIG